MAAKVLGAAGIAFVAGAPELAGDSAKAEAKRQADFKQGQKSLEKELGF